MREIKFRAWDKWCEISEDNPTSMVEETHRVMVKLNGDVYNSEYGDDQNDRYVLMQYTGLKDNNGVDIYEGDIVQDEIGIGVVSFINSGKYNVIGYAIKYNDEKFVFLFSEMEYEVIGNIYENKDLLN